MQIKNEKLRIFLRRKGQYLIGGALAVAFIGLMILGMNKSVTIGEDYIGTKKVQEKIEDKIEEQFGSTSEAKDDIWDRYYGLNELGLRYDAHIADLEGEMFLYTVELDRAADDSVIKELNEQILKKCGKPSEDNNYGEYSIRKTGDKTLLISLDLGNALDTKAITGIFRALNDIEGVKKAVVNTDSPNEKENRKLTKAPDADAETDEESARAWAEYAVKLKTHFDSLGLSFHVKCDAIGTAFTLNIIFKEEATAEDENTIKEKLGSLLDEKKRSWTTVRRPEYKANSIVLIITADSYEYVYPPEGCELCDSLLKLLDSNVKGITEVRIN